MAKNDYQKLIKNAKSKAFENWAKTQFCLFLGIKLQQFEKYVDWGKDTGKLIYIPKTHLDLDLPKIEKQSLMLGSNEKSGYQPSQKSKRLIFGFDLITSLGWILGGFEEYLSQERDRFGRWSQSNSLLSNHGLVEKPYINQWINEISKFLHKNKVKLIPLWPKNKTWVVVTSHDIEGLNFVLGKVLKDFGKGVVNKDLGLLRFSLIKLVSTLIFTLTDGGRFKKGFKDLLNTVKELELKSSIFICGATKNSQYLSFNDPDYDITNTEVLKSVKEAVKLGLSIGIHPVIYTAPYKSRYLDQIKHIEKNIGTKVNSCRHHYWNISRTDTGEALSAMNQAGIKYDTSLSFYNSSNFRRSVALPFKPFDIKNAKTIDLIEIPSTFMDQWSIKNSLSKHLDLVKKLRGVATLDWHSNRFSHNYYKKQKDLFIKTIKKLKQDKSVWLTNIEEVGDWWEKRTKNLGF